MSLRDWFIAPAPENATRARPQAGGGWAPPSGAADESPASPWAPPSGGVAARGGITCAAVLGRAGEAELFAAALALALRRAARAPAATVVVIGAGVAAPAATGGTRGARRLGARLGAHGFEAAEQGRLAWVRLPAGAAAGARRAALVGVPAVVAVTAPLTAALEAVIAEQELAVVVTADGEGPLARLAGLERAIVTAPPLPRGLARWLTRAGITAPRTVREIATR